MKPVGKPDAGNPHVRFDERGRETECCRMAQATAPVLDSTPGKKQTASSCGDGGYGDGIAEVLETLDVPLGLVGLAAFEVLGAEVLVEHATLEHVVGRGQDRGRHGSGCL